MRVLAARASWLLAPLIFLAMQVLPGPNFLFGDFRAFYCAGVAVGERANPYVNEPLHDCEAHTQPAESVQVREVTVPAPLPPYALLGFVLLARLPFSIAAVIFTLASIAAASGAVLLFARLTGTSAALLNVVFAPILATQVWGLGQPVPFVFLAIAAAAMYARRAKWTAAAICALAATGEPHLALPVIAALFIAAPRTRLPIAIGSLVLGLLCVAAVGVATSVSYVRDVIPAHALANAYEWQFSLTSLLTAHGVTGTAAVRWGEAMYAVMTAIGVWTAMRLWKALRDPAVLVLVPPAFAVFGGVHVHLAQLAVAFPAMMFVYERFPRVRTAAATGLAFAMIPWTMSASILTGATPIFVGAFARATLGARRGLVLALISAAIALAMLALAVVGLGPQEIPFTPHRYPPNALAELSWGDFSRAALARTSVLMDWLRLPTLVGLALGLSAIARSAFQADESRARKRSESNAAMNASASLSESARSTTKP